MDELLTYCPGGTRVSFRAQSAEKTYRRRFDNMCRCKWREVHRTAYILCRQLQELVPTVTSCLGSPLKERLGKPEDAFRVMIIIGSA